MNTPEWVKDAIFYQIFPDRFARSQRMPDIGFEPWDSQPTAHGFKGGDLYGVAEKLDYLKELGITAIYFTPVFASASNHRYHTFDYYSVDQLLGGNEALRHLLDQAHKRKMRVVLDGVFNHASRGFWQFHHVLENGDGSPYIDWFYFDPERLKRRRHWGAYPATGELHALQNGEGSLKAIGYQAWWNLPALPKFNTKTPAVREFLFGVAEYWTKFGIDGWRLDVPGEIDDDSFWREFRRRVRAINPEAYIVGEIWHEAQRWLQGDQFDATMNYLLTAGLLGFCGGTHVSMHEVNRVGGYQGRVTPHMQAEDFASHIDYLLGLYKPEFTQAQLNLLDSHDTPRFLTCVKNDKAALKLAWQFIFTFPGAPCIYYGDEIGMEGSHDPDCRRSFPWDESKWDHDLRDHLKTLITLRKAHPVLRMGEYRKLYAEHGVIVFERADAGEKLIVALNASESARQVEVPREAGTKTRILLGQAPAIPSKDGRIQFTLSARSGIIVQENRI
jgi:cyclomaltodextrinase